MARADRTQSLILAAGLLAAGAAAWWIELRPPLQADTSPLETLPAEIGVWQSIDIPLEETVEAMLRADFNLQRVYVHPLGHQVELYVGYYSTERGGRPEHTPWACYPSAGFEILSSDVVLVDRRRNLRANEIVVEREGDRHLVHFWFRSFRETGLLDGIDQVRDRLVGRLSDGRSDGALVRVSTPLRSEGADYARGRLISLGTRIDQLLEERWPVEVRANGTH